MPRLNGLCGARRSLSALIDNRIFCVHGGLSPTISSLDQARPRWDCEALLAAVPVKRASGLHSVLVSQSFCSGALAVIAAPLADASGQRQCKQRTQGVYGRGARRSAGRERATGSGLTVV